MQDRSLLEPLKAYANELYNTEFVWYDGSENSTVSIGIDWDNMLHVLVDFDHPDGYVVQDLGSLDVGHTNVLEEDI